jgi:hypothetical protein
MECVGVDHCRSCYLSYALIFICKGWTMIYNLLPELFFLILIAIVFGLIRSFIKIRHIL